MSPGRRPRIAPIVALVVICAVLWKCSPLGPGLPPHATSLSIETEAPHLLPTMACPAAQLGPVRVATSGGDLIVVSVETGALVPVVWPSGWAAWRIGGQAQLVARDGSIVAREGEVIEDRFGGGEGVDGAFHVCIFGW